MPTVALPGAYRLTSRDWLGLPDDGRFYELLDGDLCVAPPPSIEHQRLSRDLEFELLTHLRRSNRGEVFDAPIGVRLGDDTVLEPDIVVVLQEHADRIQPQWIDGAPDLVVEVLSPGTARRDLVSKREAYQAAAVPEYWIVDPVAQTIEVLALERSLYARTGLFRRDQTLRSPILPELAIDLATIFRPR